MTVSKMDERPGPPAGRNMKEVTALELQDAIAKLLHDKTGNHYTVYVDSISFTKDPNFYDSGQFAARFERNISAERRSIEEIAAHYSEE